MHHYTKPSHSEATRMIEEVVKEAEKINKPIAVAVSGPEGELIAFLRMDGVNAASATIAQAKAYTSAVDRKTTREMGAYMREKQSPPAFWADPKITGFGGGVPILHESVVIGGIGVSGLSQEEDERIARAAIKAVYS
ncbi:MAG: GlcG/HbpS family heme-binding protein [Bacteroidota bacterium]